MVGVEEQEGILAMVSVEKLVTGMVRRICNAMEALIPIPAFGLRYDRFCHAALHKAEVANHRQLGCNNRNLSE